MNILLGVTGSVAAIKTRELWQSLSALGDVKIVPTEAGMFFIEKSETRKATSWQELMDMKPLPIVTDKQEWDAWSKLGDPVLHIELRRWASCLVIAPLDANTLAKMANGMCDNLLTSIVRAWDWTKPVFACPAMNTMMWHNPPTANHLEALQKISNCRNFYVVRPVEKRLACDDVGMGAMAPIETIVKMINSKLRWFFPLERCNGIPINHHPGAFGFHRRKNHHTGVDLYCKDGERVHAVEDGIIVKVDVFTGPKAGHDWWEETWGVMVEGASGVINYGEIQPTISEVGDRVQRGQYLGSVKRVLFADRKRPDIPGHSTSMLHFELYKHGTRDFADWHDVKKNPDLLDPTPFLMVAENAPATTLTWDNPEEKTVG